MAQEIEKKNELIAHPSAKTTKDDPFGDCAGVECLVVVPVRAIAKVIESGFSSALVLPRAASEVHEDLLKGTASLSYGVREGLKGLASGAGAFVDGTRKVAELKDEGIKGISDGLKHVKKSHIEIGQAIQDTVEGTAQVIKTAQKVSEGITKVGEVLDAVPATGRKIEEIAQATTRFFDMLKPSDPDNLQQVDHKESIAVVPKSRP